MDDIYVFIKSAFCAAHYFGTHISMIKKNYPGAWDGRQRGDLSKLCYECTGDQPCGPCSPVNVIVCAVSLSGVNLCLVCIYARPSLFFFFVVFSLVGDRGIFSKKWMHQLLHVTRRFCMYLAFFSVTGGVHSDDDDDTVSAMLRTTAAATSVRDAAVIAVELRQWALKPFLQSRVVPAHDGMVLCR